MRRNTVKEIWKTSEITDIQIKTYWAANYINYWGRSSSNKSTHRDREIEKQFKNFKRLKNGIPLEERETQRYLIIVGENGMWLSNYCSAITSSIPAGIFCNFIFLIKNIALRPTLPAIGAIAPPNSSQLGPEIAINSTLQHAGGKWLVHSQDY